jgi:hypothetical protein
MRAMESSRGIPAVMTASIAATLRSSSLAMASTSSARARRPGMAMKARMAIHAPHPGMNASAAAVQTAASAPSAAATTS